ncbi:hypothetical protein Emed_000014 [Eimeria media]
MGASHSKLQGQDCTFDSSKYAEDGLWHPADEFEVEEEELQRQTHKREVQAKDQEGEEGLENSFQSFTSTTHSPLNCSVISLPSYMNFSNGYFPSYHTYAFSPSRPQAEAPTHREQLLLAANARLQDQASCLQLENNRLNQLISQGQHILLERDNLTVANRDQRRRLEIARQQWEKLQRDYEKLKDKVLQQDALLCELPALRRQAYKRLHKQDLETRVRAASQAKELDDAKTAIVVLKDELRFTKDQLKKQRLPEFLTPLSSPTTERLRRNNIKAPNDKSSPPSPHKMVDDETSAQSSNASGMQLRSRKITKATSSRRGEGGVAALMMGHGPSMTSEDDGSYPSASSHTHDKDEDNEPFEIRTNKEKEQDSSATQQLHPTALAASKNETTQLQHMMTMLSKLTMRVEEQSRESDRYRQLIETLLHPTQQRALTLMESPVLHRYLIEKSEYEPTWEGIKKFVASWYGHAEEHTVREKFKRLRWKGSVDQLDKDLRAALDVCTTIPDVDLTSTFVALIPEGMRAYWISKRDSDDRYRRTVTICLDEVQFKQLQAHLASSAEDLKRSRDSRETQTAEATTVVPTDKYHLID